MLTLAEFSLGDLILSMIWLFFLIIWFWLLITVFADMFRNHEMNGWVKALWVIFVIILPFLGILIYLIVHGSDMQKRQMQAATDMAKAQDEYIRSVAGSGGSTADELAKLADLKAKGAISDEEYQQLKAKALG